MPPKVTLFPIYAVADMIDERPFDRNDLPYPIMDGLRVEDVTPMFNPETFALAEMTLGGVMFKTLRT